MHLRPANLNDERRLLLWRNDPETRQASLNQHIISTSEHFKWLSESLHNPFRKLLIAEKNGIPVGTFRIDEKPHSLYLSWTIAPEWRRRGLGKEMIETVKIDKHKPLKAAIRKTNIPSIKLALHLGLSVAGEENGFYIFIKNQYE